MTALVKWGIAAALVIGLGWWAWSTFVPSSDEKTAVAEEQKRVAREQAEEEAKRVATMVDSVVAARLRSVQAGTVIREILTRPTPTRAPTPTNLPSLSPDSLIRIIVAKDSLLDAAAIRYADLRTAVVYDSIADAVLTRQQDSIIASQARQIAAHQREIAADNTIIAVQECRILGLLKCPSRKVAAIGGAVIATAAMGYARNR